MEECCLSTLLIIIIIIIMTKCLLSLLIEVISRSVSGGCLGMLMVCVSHKWRIIILYPINGGLLFYIP